MEKKNEQSRRVGGKPGAKDEAENRKATKTESKTTEQKKAAKPKNADVGNVKKDR